MVFFFRKRKIPLERIDGNTHGTHLEAMYPDLEKILKFIQENLAIENIMVISEQPFADRGKTSIVGHKLDLNEYVSLIVVLAEINGNYELATAYPVLFGETKADVKINKILEWPIQIEATIEGEIGEASLNFFPTDFFYLRDEYIQGKVNKVSLGFFAYNQSTNVFKDETMEIDGKKIKLDEAEIILPLKHGYLDDYIVSGKVEDVREVKILDEDAIITRIKCLPIGELEIFALKRNTDKVPDEGDIVYAVGWLQGRNAEENK